METDTASSASRSSIRLVLATADPGQQQHSTARASTSPSPTPWSSLADITNSSQHPSPLRPQNFSEPSPTQPQQVHQDRSAGWSRPLPSQPRTKWVFNGGKSGYGLSPVPFSRGLAASALSLAPQTHPASTFGTLPPPADGALCTLSVWLVDVPGAVPDSRQYHQQESRNLRSQVAWLTKREHPAL